MDLVVYDDADRRYVPWSIGLTALLLVAAAVGAVTFLLGRSAAGAQEVGGVSAPAPATAPSPSSSSGSSTTDACTDALVAADTALERAARIDQALAAHTRIVDGLLAERLTTEQALEQVLPVLTGGATDRRLFAEERAAYDAVRQECPTG